MFPKRDFELRAVGIWEQRFSGRQSQALVWAFERSALSKNTDVLSWWHLFKRLLVAQRTVTARSVALTVESITDVVLQGL